MNIDCLICYLIEAWCESSMVFNLPELTKNCAAFLQRKIWTAYISSRDGVNYSATQLFYGSAELPNEHRISPS